MTYRELAEMLSTLSEEKLDMDVTIFDTDADEFRGSVEFDPSFSETDVLDPDHPILIF